MSILNPIDEANQKKLIGEFFIQFDQSLSVIPFIIPNIIYKKEPSETDKRNIETVLSGTVASSLRSIFDALLVDNYPNLPELIDLNKKLSAHMDKITTFRNSFAHGSYRLGWKNFNGETDKYFFSLRHSKATKNGFQKRSGIYKTSQLQELIRQLYLIYNAYIKIASIVKNDNIGYDINGLVESLERDVSEIGKIDFDPIETLD